VEGLSILDYGCGRGDMTLEYLRNGAAKVSAIDISSVYVADGDRKAREEGFAPDRYHFQVMDAHQLDFPDNSFDIVAGWSILHHLNPVVAMNEIHRVLKPGGRVLLWEPLADHPMLRLFRWLTPSARTVDELPFTGKAIRQIVGQREWRSELGYCGLLEAPLAMLTSVILRPYPKNPLMHLADAIERWTHERGILLSWNQHVLFNMVKTA
jgi:ubiquinone/menaquinone biosynthesis C-methylase UbiE